ncbi:hypothetical protein CDAR_122541 [Caerostris darwini]|uniref:Uncharacterized protein n=1 Tax=Caerostris darwini TaxID=1538125 RepID=A0AAV4M9T1_9ARAC|nr:hypothetical protein CDAR_122541 [Caerostris darwini]
MPSYLSRVNIIMERARGVSRIIKKKEGREGVIFFLLSIPRGVQRGGWSRREREEIPSGGLEIRCKRAIPIYKCTILPSTDCTISDFPFWSFRESSSVGMHPSTSGLLRAHPVLDNDKGLLFFFCMRPTAYLSPPFLHLETREPRMRKSAVIYARVYTATGLETRKISLRKSCTSPPISMWG